MPVIIDKDLPTFTVLEREGKLVLPKGDSKPRLKVALVNLMPTKVQTEIQFARLLSHSPETVGLELVCMETHQSQNTDSNHIERFYKPSSWLYGNKPDGIIVTGAPVELMEYEQVDYWEELSRLLDWIPGNVRTSVFVCWGAQAALHHYFGIDKKLLPKKLFGVFPHEVCIPGHPIIAGLTSGFAAPHSRYTENTRFDIESNPNLEVLCKSDKAGVLLSWARKWQMFFISGHPEYDSDTLKNEYLRDRQKGLETAIPENYFENDDPEGFINNTWEQAGRTLYSNWLAHFVAR